MNVSSDQQNLFIENHRIELLTAADPSTIDWKSRNIDWVVEASGHFTNKNDVSKHLFAGAHNVLITAPSKDADITIIPGINDTQFRTDKHHIVSLGSCTTNCFAPIIKVLDDAFTLTNGLMTTIHAYTNSQVLIDIADSDPRRARAAAENIIPSNTGASDVIGLLFPHLKTAIKAAALRVPVPIVSIIDFTFNAKKPMASNSINDAFMAAAQGPLASILAIEQRPLVSSDFRGNPHSCIIDAPLTQTIGNMGKVFGWYDNEWGYSQRLVDFLLHISGKIN